MPVPFLARALVPIALVATTAPAAVPRDMLMEAGFAARDLRSAEAGVEAARVAAEQLLAQNPRDREARLQQALAIGYRATLRKNRADALTARRLIEGLAAADPRDAEAQLAIAGWHLNSIDELGAMMARTALGARKPVGDAALARAVALGQQQPGILAMAGMMLVRGNPKAVVDARALIERAATLPPATSFDRAMQRSGAAILPALKAGNGTQAATQARLLLPFGRVPRK